MDLYRQHAAGLATAAAAEAVKNANVAACDVTHLVMVSCTGFDAPGVDIQLIERLGLSPTTQRVTVGFMGCHGAINGLRVVRGIVAADPDAVVLMVCVELCSLHYRTTWDDDAMVGNALFADGAGAIVAVDKSRASASPGIADTASCLLEDSTSEMSWQIGDHGFDMRITGKVPEKIQTQLGPWLTDWLGLHDLSPEGIENWIVHPGGPRILDAARNALSLDEDALQASRTVLQSYGNMSSPTVLFILNQTLPLTGPAVVLAFGPGLVAEAALLLS